MDLSFCLRDFCSHLCVKQNIIDDDKHSKFYWTKFLFLDWTKFFSRAPADSMNCLDACYIGCHYKK